MNFKVDSYDLDVEALCDFNNDESKGTIDMALREWHRTNSHVTHWYNMVARYLSWGRNPFFNPDVFNFEPSDKWEFYYGLPKKDAQEMCKTVYKETIAKVTIEILDPMVLQIKKDIRTTFTQQLGAVGRNIDARLNLNTPHSFSFQGGTLGLFTGASIVSLVELLFWIYKVIKLFIRNMKHNLL